jgi:hypothetical protein
VPAYGDEDEEHLHPLHRLPEDGQERQTSHDEAGERRLGETNARPLHFHSIVRRCPFAIHVAHLFGHLLAGATREHQRVFVGVDGTKPEEHNGQLVTSTAGLEFEVYIQGMFKTELCNMAKPSGSKGASAISASASWRRMARLALQYQDAANHVELPPTPGSASRTPSSSSPTTTSPAASPCSAATRAPPSHWPSSFATASSDAAYGASPTSPAEKFAVVPKSISIRSTGHMKRSPGTAATASITSGSR